MEHTFQSPSLSPQNGFMSQTQFFDNTSESSSPDSPRQMQRMPFNNSMTYDMYNGTIPTNIHPTPLNKVSIDFVSDSVDENRRKRRSISSPNSGDRETIPNMHLRRRAQNRASQRAFRERKEKHVKGLEHQLEELHEKHQDLLQSFSKQADEVSRLHGQIADLNTQLNALRSTRDSSYSELLLPDKFDKFDAFSSNEMGYGGLDCYFDKHAVDLNSDFALHSFEDSL